MSAFLSDSALKKAYDNTGLTIEQIDTVVGALEACAHFYVILEVDDAFRILKPHIRISKARFDQLIPVLQSDPYVPFEIGNEKDYYRDGEDVLYLLDTAYFLKYNKKFKVTNKNRPINAAGLFEFDYDRFYKLNQDRAGKDLVVPRDLLKYADPDYLPETMATKAMRAFLETNLPASVNAEHALLESVRRIREADRISADMTHFLWDLIAPENQTEKNLETYLDLYTELQNTTPLPCHRGASPDDFASLLDFREQKFATGLPGSGRTGPLLSGSPFGNAGGRMTDLQRIANLASLNPELKQGMESLRGGMLRNVKKVGPNDPCPCGSGRKFKKCCGSK